MPDLDLSYFLFPHLICQNMHFEKFLQSSCSDDEKALTSDAALCPIIN